MIKHVCIYGVGGVGGYFGAKIIANDREQNLSVSFVARGAHLQAIQKSGLTLQSEGDTINVRPSLATSDVTQIPKPDLVLVCVKSYDLDEAINSLQSVLDKDCIILPLLNGVDIYQRIKKLNTEANVLPACVYVGTHILEPGVIFQKGGAAKVVFGDDTKYGSESALKVKTFFDSYKIKYEYYSDPYSQIWTKYMFIAAYGMVTAATGKTLGEVYQDDKLREDVEKIMREIFVISQAEGVSLAEDVITSSLCKAESFPYEAKTSFQRDYENPAKQNEKELFGGTIIRLGQEYGIATPTTKKYYH